MIKTCLMAALLAMACAFAWQGAARQNGNIPQKAAPPIQVASNAARHDHVGKPLPDYMTGDQCLFCHRGVVGPTWQQEPHAWTIRDVGVPPSVPKPPADATHVIGSSQHFRALKLIGYGKFAVLGSDGKTWHPDIFAPHL